MTSMAARGQQQRALCRRRPAGSGGGGSSTSTALCARVLPACSRPACLSLHLPCSPSQCAIYGSFSEKKTHELVVARGRVLELLRPDDGGKVQVVHSTDVFGVIRSLVPFRCTACVMHGPGQQQQQRQQPVGEGYRRAPRSCAAACRCCLTLLLCAAFAMPACARAAGSRAATPTLWWRAATAGAS